MEQKRAFEEKLQLLLKKAFPVLNQDIVSMDENKKLLLEIEPQIKNFYFWPTEIEFFIDQAQHNFYYIRTFIEEGEKNIKLSHVPFDCKETCKGKELENLIKLLIVESLDQYFAKSLQKTVKRLQLDKLIDYQEQEYQILNEKLQEKHGLK